MLSPLMYIGSQASVYSFHSFCSFRLDNEVYAWGNNSMGQCGQGNSTGPLTKPKKGSGLDGVAIQQISAGTSHSLAWTALPRDRHVMVALLAGGRWVRRSRAGCRGFWETSWPSFCLSVLAGRPSLKNNIGFCVLFVCVGGDLCSVCFMPAFSSSSHRQVVAWHRPYCVDLEESTFSHLRSFLEQYCDKINSEVPPLPFPSSRYLFPGLLQSLLLLNSGCLPFDLCWRVAARVLEGLGLLSEESCLR